MSTRNSKERVSAAFEHREIYPVPRWIGMSTAFETIAKKNLNIDEEGLRIRLGDDFRRIFARYTGPEFAMMEGAHTRTLFGVYHGGHGYGIPLTHPFGETSKISEIMNYQWPDPKWIDVSSIREDALSWKGDYAILGGDWSPFWHDLIDLFGMEKMYYLMYDAPELIDATLDRILDYYLEVSKNIFEAAKGAIDIFFIGNDLGSQTGPLLGEDLFRRFILPHIARLVRLGHDYGIKVQMHCCGGFAPLIPALIEIELDALHAIQTTCRGMNIEELKKNFGDKIVLNGGIDSHHTLIESTPEKVRAATRETLNIMAPGGGYIAGASHDSILEETPVENILAMCDAIEEFNMNGSSLNS